MKKVKGKYTLKILNTSVADEGMYQFQIRGVRSEAELACSGKSATPFSSFKISGLIQVTSSTSSTVLTESFYHSS